GAGDADGKRMIGEAATGEVLRTFPDHNDYVYSVAFSPDGRRLASASWQEVKVWDVATGEELRALGRIAGVISSVAFSPDGKHLAAGGGYRGRGEIKIWDAP